MSRQKHDTPPDMSLRSIKMQLGKSNSMLYLKWELPFRTAGHVCPHDRCGRDIKLDPLDTPPRSYSELVEVTPRAVQGRPLEERLDRPVACRVWSLRISGGTAPSATSCC